MKRQAFDFRKRTATILRAVAVLCFCCLSATGMSWCARSDRLPTPAVTVLQAMMAATGDDWPQGDTYALTTTPVSEPVTVPDEEIKTLTDTLISALYGEASRGWLTGEDPPVCDAAVFLPTVQHPAELAVFRCATAEDAGTVAMTCRARLDDLTRHWETGAYAAWVGGATVTVRERYVLLILTDDPSPLLHAASSAIRAGG